MSAQPADLIPTRTEVDVAAETLAAVLLTGMFGQDETMVARCVQAVGITTTDLKRAAQRIAAQGYTHPRGLLVATPEAVHGWGDGPAQRNIECVNCGESFTQEGAGRSRRWCFKCRPTPNKAPETDRRKCKQCSNTKPIEQFQQRTDSNSRRTICDDCRKHYQRHRYLSVETSERLGTILRFFVEDNDPCVGDTCPRCHNAFDVGEEVATDDVILVHHVSCPGASS